MNVQQYAKQKITKEIRLQRYKIHIV